MIAAGIPHGVRIIVETAEGKFFTFVIGQQAATELATLPGTDEIRYVRSNIAQEIEDLGGLNEG